MEKIGTIGAQVRTNKAMRDDGAGGQMLRAPKTWEEAQAGALCVFTISNAHKVVECRSIWPTTYECDCGAVWEAQP